MSVPTKNKSLLEKIAATLLKGEEPEILTDEQKKRIAESISNKAELNQLLDAEGQQFLARITGKQKKNFRVRRLYWYSAAASILILVSVGLFLYQNIEDSIYDDGTYISIKTGTDKATLTLSDGSEVSLEKGQTYTSEHSVSNGEKITYQSAKTTGNDIKYNYLTIPRGGQFLIKLSDGTQVWLNSETQIKYPVTFSESETRKVELVYGEAYFDVSPSTENNGTKFKVLNQSQEIEVLGTEFNIKAYKDETYIYTTLVEGKVSITGKGLDDKLLMEPNHMTTLNLQNRELIYAPTNVYYITSWREGVFVFKSETLEEIFKVLGRWYDFKVVFKNDITKKIRFDGLLSRDEKITKLMQFFVESNFIEAYDIDNKTIIIQ